MIPSVSLIIPTRNESGNLPELVRRIKVSLWGYDYRIVVVDDSDDNTPQVAELLGCHVIYGRHLGLAQAVIDGIDGTESDYIILMDSDLQHPPELLPQVVGKLGRFDLVVVTKHGKGADDKLSVSRKLQSYLGVLAAKKLIPAPVSDPMSGFLGVRRKCLEGVELEGIGFKVGLEIIVKAKWVSHYELPMKFGERQAGTSKGTAHSLQKHLWHLFNWHLENKIRLPKGSDEYYNFYEGDDWNKDWKQSIAVVLQGITKNIESQKLLDVGAGSSPNINYMVAKGKIGMDIRPEALTFMRQHSDATFVQGSVLKIPYPEAFFDTVTCIEVLEHLYPEDVHLALSELTRVLQPDGYLILATPNYSSPLWNIIENAQKVFQRGKWTSDHHTKFNRRSLNTICEMYGLEEVRYDGVMGNMDMVATYRKDG